MEASKKTARIAGLLALIVFISGTFAHSINTKLIVYDDAVITSKNIIDFEYLFRLGLISGLIMQTVFILYPLVLYKLLKTVNKDYAALMVILALTSVPIFMLNQLNKVTVLISAINQSYDQLLFSLAMHKYGGGIVAIFFGLWLFPLGILIFKSHFIPRILGILLMIGCFGYITLFIQTFLFPDIKTSLWNNPALIITHISELLLMLWLLIKGINVKKK